MPLPRDLSHSCGVQSGLNMFTFLLRRKKINLVLATDNDRRGKKVVAQGNKAGWERKSRKDSSSMHVCALWINSYDFQIKGLWQAWAWYIPMGWHQGGQKEKQRDLMFTGHLLPCWALEYHLFGSFHWFLTATDKTGVWISTFVPVLLVLER